LDLIANTLQMTIAFAQVLILQVKKKL